MRSCEACRRGTGTTTNTCRRPRGPYPRSEDEVAEGVEIGPDRASYGLGSARRDDGNETRWTHTAKGVRIGAAMQTKDARRDGDTIRVPVVLANDFEETNGGPESAPGVRRVVTEGLVDLVDTRVTPLWVPEDLVRRLGLRERDRRWEGRPWAGPIAAADRRPHHRRRVRGRTVGQCRPHRNDDAAGTRPGPGSRHPHAAAGDRNPGLTPRWCARPRRRPPPPGPAGNPPPTARGRQHSESRGRAGRHARPGRPNTWATRRR